MIGVFGCVNFYDVNDDDVRLTVEAYLDETDMV